MLKTLKDGSECAIYIKCDGNRCPCCKYQFRNKRRNINKVH